MNYPNDWQGKPIENLSRHELEAMFQFIRLKLDELRLELDNIRTARDKAVQAAIDDLNRIIVGEQDK